MSNIDEIDGEFIRLPESYNEDYLGTYYSFGGQGVAYGFKHNIERYPDIKNEENHPIVIDILGKDVDVRKLVESEDDSVLLLGSSDKEYDKCISRLTNIWRSGKFERILAYDLEKVLDRFAEWDSSEIDMNEKLENAYEFWSFNMLGAWMGVKTPIYISVC